MLKNYYSYPAFFFYDNDGVSVEFPDLPGCLPCAEDEESIFRNAREALGLHLFGMESDGEDIPEPTPVSKLTPEPGAVVAMVDVFMPPVRERVNRQVVKKILTIPSWLNKEAEEAGVNFSQVLQDGLKQSLGVQ
ncbi:MAG: type II toxin-antitoxin system HicB family antitoxin [Oscillospiraceae bacterium]|nr:type II toxin-antitoxin system HicB family antitoxin [Oscillospiraceae bacterium]